MLIAVAIIASRQGKDSYDVYYNYCWRNACINIRLKVNGHAILREFISIIV